MWDQYHHLQLMELHSTLPYFPVGDISYQSVRHGLVRLDREPQGLVVGSALHVRDRDLGEVVDPERRREVSGVGENDAEGGADGAHLHADEGALAVLQVKDENNQLHQG